MSKKVLTLLGFAAKAGKLSFGFDACVSALKSGKSKLVVIACDISPKSRKEAIFYAEKASVKQLLLVETNIETLSAAVGRKCGIISVDDSGFADAITLKAHM